MLILKMKKWKSNNLLDFKFEKDENNQGKEKNKFLIGNK